MTRDNVEAHEDENAEEYYLFISSRNVESLYPLAVEGDS